MAEEERVILERLKQIDEEISETRDAKEDIVRWSLENKGLPVVKVKGIISEGNAVFGPNASTILKKSYKNEHIKETSESNTAGVKEWKISVIPQKS